MDSRQGTDFRRPVLYGARAFVRAEKPNCEVIPALVAHRRSEKFESRSRHFKYQQPDRTNIHDECLGIQNQPDAETIRGENWSRERQLCI
jgi:hypothetical protein